VNTNDARRGDPRGLLLEREHDLATFDGLLGGATSGDGRVAVVVGRAGIGKSRLLAEVRAMASTAGFTVLGARASELEREFAFGVVRQLFERAVRATPAWWNGAAARASVAFDGGIDDDAGSFEDVSESVLHGLYWLAVNASARGPVLICVDDLQWCDRSSLRFLSYLGRRVDGLPIVVAGSLRTSSAGGDDHALAELVADPATVIIEPQPLSVDAVTELLQDRLHAAPDPGFAAHCHRLTGGNPLLVGELSRAMLVDGVRPDVDGVEVIAALSPRAVSRTVLLRLARLGVDAAHVAHALAVVGDGEQATIVGAVADLDAAAVERASRALVQAEVVEPGPELRFVHPLVRDAVYHDLSAAELERRHLLAAEVLRAHERPAEQIAAHAVALSPARRPWVVPTLREAAANAVRRGAPESATAYLRRALAEPPAPEDRPHLLVELGVAESHANEPAAAIEHLQAATAGRTDPGDLGAVAGLLARLLIFTDPPDDAVAVIRQARRALPTAVPDRDDLDAGLAAVELYAVNFGATDADTAARLADVEPPAPGTGAGACMLAATAAWDRALTGGPADVCRELAQRALADGSLVGADPWFMSIVAAGVLVLADADDAPATWEQLQAEGRRRGSRLTMAGVQLWQGWNQLEWGLLADADESLRNYVDETLRRNGQDESGMAYGAAFLARVMLERGDNDGARAVLRGVGRPVPGSDGDLLLRRSEIELALAVGDWNAALGTADELAQLRPRVVNPAWCPRGQLRARALAGMERYDEAGAAARDDVAAAQQWGTPRAIGMALRCLGEVLDAEGSTACFDVLEDSLTSVERGPSRLEEAKVSAALGAARRRRNQAAASRPLLARAVDLATRCGATPLVERATAELRVAGGRPRRRAVSGVDALTPSERRVVEMASTGRTNRAIAQELFVTPKTVEVHLSSAYRKLGIRSRNDLADLHLV
jgi:DNA-binding CsgD family transcriptional regulator/tetratricopeptide (TPR) repeat protein